GAVQAATQRDALLHHLSTYHGVSLPDMQQHTVERCLDDPLLPETVRQLLSLRRYARPTRSAKCPALLNCTSRDGRLRG
ncbi:DNA polymerase, partial [Xylella fastidiosa subsp. multiplex]|nr:DNA polymerase [Xylella fastidiosa subsp. multiplex]